MTTQQTLQTEEYKQTELGELPKEWDVVKLGDVANYINGYPFKPIQWKKSGIPIIRIQNLTGSSNKENYFDGSIPEKYKVKKGDILISWSASLGIFEWVREDGWLNQHIFKVENYSPKINKDFFYYVVGTQINFMKGKTHGSTMHHITKLSFLDVNIPLPSLQEQQKIAYVLSTVQNAQEKTENFINCLKELKKSAMKHLLTYGAVSFEDIDKVELKESEIGMMPKSWKIKELGKIGTFQYGYTETSSEKKIGPKFLRITDIDLNKSQVFWGTVPYCKIDNKEYSKYSLSDGDILIARIGATTGKTFII